VPGSHIGVVVFVVRDFKDEFIDLYAIVVHLETFGDLSG
jgi:hypothetical protein